MVKKGYNPEQVINKLRESFLANYYSEVEHFFYNSYKKVANQLEIYLKKFLNHEPLILHSA